uniref:adenine-specific methyltransferase EcoRI family protein n=1 Tax=Treponema endosymbiont of Eucomonympha sp. TaxID=1580831 RepID=UPI000751A644
TVFCNCDDPYWSDFFYYFVANFNALGLKKLIATHYIDNDITLFDDIKPERPYSLTITKAPQDLLTLERPAMVTRIIAENGGRTPLTGDGDFRSAESVALLKETDIVVTNPPFSLFREFAAQLVAYDKKFLIIGSMNAITYKEIFKLIKENKLWLGFNNFDGSRFIMPNYYDITQSKYAYEEKGIKYGRVSGIHWFTNMDIQKRHEDLILYKRYTADEYPKYDNYDAIDVSKTADIPLDYDGVMGVPITFLDKYNPEQFEIIGNEYDLKIDKGRGYINGKRMYGRLFIKNKKAEKQ